MSEKPGLLSRVMARVRAVLPEQWRGDAGRRYRDTIEAVSEYSKKNVRIQERLNEAPDVIVNTLKLKSSEALLKAAEEENKRIASELARQTLSDKARQEKATADRMEIEARTAMVKEMQERITLVDKLRSVNCVPVWDNQGNMRIVKAPPNYDWDGLTSSIVEPIDLSKSRSITTGTTTTTTTSTSTSTATNVGRNESSSDQIVGDTGIPSEERFGVGGSVSRTTGVSSSTTVSEGRQQTEED